MTNRLPLMLLKQQIINVLYKSHIPSKIEHPQLHNNKDDYTNEDLLNICIYFINGKYYHQENDLENAKTEFNFFLLFVESFVTKLNVSKREDKIKMYHIKRNFKFDLIDWEDKNWLNLLLEYFYVLCLEDKYYIELEIEIKSVQNKNNNLTIKAVDYLTKNNYVRQNLLKTRIKPKYTLEEFGIKLAKKINNRQLEVVSEDKEETIESLRFKDELKDEMHFSKGNTDNKS